MDKQSYGMLYLITDNLLKWKSYGMLPNAHYQERSAQQLERYYNEGSLFKVNNIDSRTTRLIWLWSWMYAGQKMNFSIKDFPLKNFIFCPVVNLRRADNPFFFLHLYTNISTFCISNILEIGNLQFYPF